MYQAVQEVVQIAYGQQKLKVVETLFEYGAPNTGQHLLSFHLLCTCFAMSMRTLHQTVAHISPDMMMMLFGCAQAYIPNSQCPKSARTRTRTLTIMRSRRIFPWRTTNQMTRDRRTYSDLFRSSKDSPKRTLMPWHILLVSLGPSRELLHARAQSTSTTFFPLHVDLDPGI
jgi:hypothetical protein